MFRCLSPFRTRIHISLEQSVWAELSWNPFRKRIASICFGPNHSKKISGQNLDFWKSYFQFLRRNWVFQTSIKSNAAFWGPCGPKDVCICWWKISNCLKKYFWSLWSFFFKIFWRPSVTVCEKGHFLRFLGHYHV